MTSELQQLLKPVRLRMRLQMGIRCLGVAVLIGGICFLLFEIARITLGLPTQIEPLNAVAVFFVFLVCGATIGIVSDCPWTTVAHAVDRHYRLKDRVATAFEFSEIASPDAFQQLQIADAKSHIQQLDANAVVQFSSPPRWQYLPLALFFGLRIGMAPIIGNEPRLPTPTPQQAAAVVADIKDDIDDLDALAEETAADELKELVAKLRQDLKHLEVPALTIRESMKTVSEMQNKMQAMMKEMDVAAMDAQLRNVGEAIAGAKPFKPVADAIKDDNLAKAASELENLSEEELSPENMKAAEARPTAEKLAEAAESAKDEGLDELSEQLSDLSEAVKSGETKETAEEAQDLAQTIKQQNVKKKLNNLLKSKSDQLAHSKKKLTVQSQSEGDGSMAGKGQNLKQGKTGKSKNDIASQKAGAKSAGNINGPKTRLESQRQMVRLSGQLGEDGDSDKETETTQSPETQETAHRQVQEAFNRYQKMSEAVLDSENIPPGHRETIRKYFELIRPSQEVNESAGSN